MSDLSLTFLGTSAGGPPSKSRSFSSVALRTASGHLLLFDCGEGTQRQLIFKTKLRLGKIAAIFITHLHGDHVYGLVPLMSTLSWSLGEDVRLELFGPMGLRRFVRETVTLSGVDLPYRYRVTELHEDSAMPAPSHLVCPLDADLAPGEVIGSNILATSDPQTGTFLWNLPACVPGVTIQAAPLVHRVQSIGYVVTEAAWPGRLDLEAARRLLEPHRDQLGKIELHFRALKDGKDVRLPNGTTVAKATECVSDSRPGRRVVVLGDTANSRAIEPIGEFADVVVHEATLLEELKDKAVERGHSTPGMAAKFAQKIKARALILTHISGRYSLSNDGHSQSQSGTCDDGAHIDGSLYSEDESAMIKEAGLGGFDGQIFIARDTWTHEIPRIK